MFIQCRLGVLSGLHGVPRTLVSLVFQQKGPYLRGSRARSSAVEHLTFNQVVVGSIPTGLTKKSIFHSYLFKCSKTVAPQTR